MQPITCEADIARGLDALVALDPRLDEIAAQAGPVPLRLQPAGFAGLSEIVVSQMVSKASASAIFGRLVARLDGGVTGAGVRDLGADGLFAVGLSRAKASTLLAIAEAELAGQLDLEGVCGLETAAAIAHLSAVKGVGPWTAEVYLMFCAGHPDIFPVGDIALVHAVHHAFGHDEKLNGRRLAAFAESWSPWRSVAARLFWAFYSRQLRRAADPLG
ncbi:DNA-3-methyladenine glycosylase family protein [Rhizobium sp. C4]|uniref:DNA-3-methyladenine glycosylase family protein n=1 Tax=Rhizobium sp. C4 TaxID=1349800 RepID=UPI001E3CC116|nr:DNA-3-methyladenine glycosylase 2 family protein [Rhizobium sp. C4]MCD2175713.1 DNA-3-methyladenine glycosylase 2 family protein [Rhizobium sp. C4]